MRNEQEQAQKISDHIIEHRRELLTVDTPIEDLNQEELTSLVNEGFDRYGINYIMFGNFNNGGVKNIFLELKTEVRLQSMEQITKLLNRKFETYIKNFEEDCQTCKGLIYECLRAYQDEQKRKKQSNPFQ